MLGYTLVESGFFFFYEEIKIFKCILGKGIVVFLFLKRKLARSVFYFRVGG